MFSAKHRPWSWLGQVQNLFLQYFLRAVFEIQEGLRELKDDWKNWMVK